MGEDPTHPCACFMLVDAAFPFVNAQIIAFFSLSIIFIFPFLYYSYVNRLWFACFMNSLTVLCFLGLHEVARELENPFINVPNDLPLCTFQVSSVSSFCRIRQTCARSISQTACASFFFNLRPSTTKHWVPCSLDIIQIRGLLLNRHQRPRLLLAMMNDAIMVL